MNAPFTYFELRSTNLASVLVGEGGRRGGKEGQGKKQVRMCQ